MCLGHGAVEFGRDNAVRDPPPTAVRRSVPIPSGRCGNYGASARIAWWSMSGSLGFLRLERCDSTTPTVLAIWRDVRVIFWVMEPHPLHKPDEYDATKHPKVEQKTIPLQGHDRSHVLDTTVGAATMLRRIYEKSYIDVDLKGELRKSKVIIAADDASELVKELQQVSALGKPNWSQVGNELAHAVREMTRLQSEATGPEKARVTQALTNLEHLVGAKIFASAKKAIDKADQLPALTVEQRIELGAQAVIAACRELALFKGQPLTHPKDKAPRNDAEKQAQQKDSSDAAATILTKVRLHYAVASDALSDLATSDEAKRRLIMGITSDVMLATKGMDRVQQFITAEDDLPWRAEFAAGFDAELRLLQIMGLDKQLLPTGRVYSGSVNPEQAIAKIAELAKHKKDDRDWTAEKFTSSQQAVEGIGVMVEELFSQQKGGLARFASDIKEPPPPKEQSKLDFLLEVLIKTVLAAGAGAIGSFVQGRAKTSMDGLTKTNAASSWVGKTVGKPGDDPAAFLAAKNAIEKQAIDTGVAANTLKAEALKDGVKELFKTVGYKTVTGALGLISGSVHSNSGEIKTVFSQTTGSVLDDASVQARMQFIHLAPALKQASPDSLWALYQTLLNSMKQANEIQYDIAHEEWQNFKARASSGVAVDHAAKDQHAYHAADVQSPKDRKAGKVAKDNPEESRDANVGGDNTGTSLPENHRPGGKPRESETGAMIIEAFVNTDDFLGATGDPHLLALRIPGAEHAAYTHFKNQNKPLQDVHLNKHFRLKFVAYMNDTTINIGVGPDHGFLESTLGDKELTALRVIAEKEKVSSGNLLAARSEEKYTRHQRKDLERVLMKYITVLQKSVKTSSLTE